MKVYKLFSKCSGHKCLINGRNNADYLQLINSNEEIIATMPFNVIVDKEFGNKELLDFNFAELPMLSESAYSSLISVINGDLFHTIRCEWCDENSSGWVYGIRVKEIDCLDYTNSKYEILKSGKLYIKEYAFVDELLREKYLFKIPNESHIFVTQKFVDLVNINKLTGFYFWPLFNEKSKESMVNESVPIKVFVPNIIIRDISDAELLSEIQYNDQYGRHILGEDSDSDYETLVNGIHNLLSDKKVIKSIAREHKDDITGIAIALGVVWGNLVCEKYKWTWQDIIVDDAFDNVRLAIVSPNRQYYIEPTTHMNDICNKKDENDTALLFQMLENIEYKYPKAAHIIRLI